jgi:DNA (cytosine-5)-methyltransferase 1
MARTFKFIDLFAGIGGFRIALESLGGKCAYTSEWDKKAQDTYEINFGERPKRDITAIKANAISTHDILCAGFPCQAFSISGKKLGFNDTRGTLFFEIARIAKYHTPKILFLENVKNFISHNKGQTLRTVLNTLDQLGYLPNYKIDETELKTLTNDPNPFVCDLARRETRKRLLIKSLKEKENLIEI